MKLVLTVDPDSIRSAYAVAVQDGERFEYLGSSGGGSGRKRVDWHTITGWLSLLRKLSEEHGVAFDDMLVVVETQGANGEHSRDVEELRRVRYHVQAACELLCVACKFVSIAWAEKFVPGAKRLGKGKQKEAYMRKSKTLTHGETDNEDRCAAFGMLVVELAAKKLDLYIGPACKDP